MLQAPLLPPCRTPSQKPPGLSFMPRRHGSIVLAWPGVVYNGDKGVVRRRQKRVGVGTGPEAATTATHVAATAAAEDAVGLGQGKNVAATSAAVDAAGRGQGHRLLLQSRRQVHQQPPRQLQVGVGTGGWCSSSRACCCCNNRRGSRNSGHKGSCGSGRGHKLLRHAMLQKQP